MAPKITILEGLRHLMRPLHDDEYNALKASIKKEGLRDPLSVWDRKADLVLLDGHNRYEIAQELNVAFRTKKIDGILSQTDAELWMIQNQLARRNITPNEKAYLIGLRYSREKDQGARTDLTGDTPTDTALRMGAEFNVSDRAIRSMGAFYEAVEELEQSIPDSKARILHSTLPLSRDEIVWLAGQPIEDHRDLWTRALKDREDLQKIMQQRGKSQRAKARIRGPANKRHVPSAMEKYDIVDMVHIIGTEWPVGALVAYPLDERRRSILAEHLEPAIASLRVLQRRLAVEAGVPATDDVPPAGGKAAQVRATQTREALDEAKAKATKRKPATKAKTATVRTETAPL